MSEPLFKECAFMLGVATPQQLPGADRPEIALAGRSNVGKSSLINALTQRKALAKTSHTPGRTQQLNFFSLGDALFMVDMPGYGFAKVAKETKGAWNELVQNYLRGRPNLRCVFVLIDSRHGIKESDSEFFEFLDQAAVPYRIVLTKTDKIKNEELQKITSNTKEILKKHTAAFPEPHYTSAHDGTGLEDLRMLIASYAS